MFIRFLRQPGYIKDAAIDMIGYNASRHISPAQAPIDVIFLLLLAASNAKTYRKFWRFKNKRLQVTAFQTFGKV